MGLGTEMDAIIESCPAADQDGYSALQFRQMKKLIDRHLCKDAVYYKACPEQIRKLITSS